jgi:beta-N-acetylhexosaminidase
MRLIPATIIAFCLFVATLPANIGSQDRTGPVLEKSLEKQWVDSVYNAFSLDERIAQLIMVRSYSNRGQTYTDSIANVLAKYNIGGVIFFRGTPGSHAVMTNQYQAAVKTPLLVAIDAEWGLGMRLDSTIAFPWNLALGAIEDDMLIYEMGVEIGRQMKRLGVHMNFAPVVDVNNNALNPVINSRSFGENNLFVASKSLAYMKGLQDMGVISVAKHFPGHGDTDKDSHYTLPLIKKPYSEIDSIHLLPYKYLIQRGLMGVMTAHLAVPAIDPDPNGISSLSSPVINGLLKEQLDFDGLIVTDGLEMKAIADYVDPDSVEIKALLAGNDILLLPVNTPRAIRNIRNAVEKGIVPESLIEERCKKILSYKYKLGLIRKPFTDPEYLYEDLNTPETSLLNRRLIEASLTVPINKNDLLPLRLPDNLRIASVEVGGRCGGVFGQRMNTYAPVSSHTIDKTTPAKEFNALLTQLSGFDLVFVCVRGTSQYPMNDYGITPQTRYFINSLAEKTQLVLVLAGNPYSLSLFEPIDQLSAIVVAYHDNDLSVDLAAQAIFGAFNVSGEMPVSVSENIKAGDGEKLQYLQRLKYTIPEETGIKREWLSKVDSIALNGIAEEAYPGCRIMAVLDGKVIYDKCFGHHTYEKIQAVKHDDLYDIASVTKIAAATLALLHLYQHQLLDIDHRISLYLPELANSDKKNIVIRDLMAHQARLQAWIPFYRNVLKNGILDPVVFRNSSDDIFNIEVARNLYMNKSHLDVIFDTIATSPLLGRHRNLYSDLGFYWLKEVVERISLMPFDEFTAMHFYEPLGLQNTVFNAHRYFEPSRIVPTEDDKEFRKQLIHGYVHDPGAAMFGGLGAHAGLFSTAGNLAVIMQMLMNSGSYGGRQYFAPQVLSEFTRTQFPLNDNRKGIGFDKPQLRREEDGPTSFGVSDSSFGHSGFTGAYAWADPEHGLVYIFLSNRVHPSASNNKLGTLNIRTSIHQVFYDALEKREKSGFPIP